jgi:hypothetical protein
MRGERKRQRVREPPRGREIPEGFSADASNKWNMQLVTICQDLLKYIALVQVDIVYCVKGISFVFKGERSAST